MGKLRHTVIKGPAQSQQQLRVQAHACGPEPCFLSTVTGSPCNPDFTCSCDVSLGTWTSHRLRAGGNPVCWDLLLPPLPLRLEHRLSWSPRTPDASRDAVIPKVHYQDLGDSATPCQDQPPGTPREHLQSGFMCSDSKTNSGWLCIPLK